MADYITNKEQLTSLADAIRGKAGLTASTSITYTTDFISYISTIIPGEYSLEDIITTSKFTSVSLSLSIIHSYAF